MANRILARHDDGTLTEQRDGEMGYEGAHAAISIERSAAGAPGLFFTLTDYHGNGLSGESSVFVPDGAAFLAPVLEWLNADRQKTQVLAAAKIVHQIECGCPYDGEHSDADIERREQIARAVLNAKESA